ncbi:2-hydroxychromene-2-carboxylate isomerase [Sneathiella limimaris]|uniref:2-hydroxychromene-2-carboxylate isomerase n=1 Tax=Sneathiella limimaris TaxID=1964213 RepID=UPI00146EF183|nr:2-hydroxychromene-2-carboxylate isomerase [Sneathiella limimaris]
MAVTAELHIDVASPNIYFCHKLIPGIEEQTGVTFKYIPVLLGGIFKLTNNQAPFLTYQNVKGKNEYMRLEMQRFVRDHAMNDFRMNSHFPVNTVMAMRGAIVADMEGFVKEYFDAVLKDMWEKSLKMDDPEVFKQALVDHGFDADHILNRIQEEDVKQQLIANTAATVERGTFGCPTLFVGDEIFFGKDSLPAVEQEILRQQGQL